MLVYANALWLDGSCNLGAPLELVAAWLSRKTKQSFTPESLQEDEDYNLRFGQRIQTWIADGEFPFLWALRYSHPDRDVHGREWITEIGLRRDGPSDEIRCTFHLEVKDISAKVLADIITTRPAVASSIAEKCPLSARTLGLDVRHLTEVDAPAFPYEVHRSDRRYPLVVVSPTTEGHYLVDPIRLAGTLVGLAQVVQIPAGANTFRIADIAGSEFISWRGAINILWPPRIIRGDSVVRHKRIRAEELEQIDGAKRANEVLAHIAHDSNLPVSHSHVTPKNVRRTAEERQRRRELAARRKEAESSGEDRALLTFLQEAFNENERTIAGLESQRDQFEREKAELEDELRVRKYENESLVASFSTMSQRGSGADGLTYELRDCLRAVFLDKPSVEQSLMVVQALYPERLVVLDSAWRSAAESESFRHRAEAFRLLRTLTGPYWEALASGTGDAEARNVFGKASFAATESESVRNNKRARKLRTFLYRGKDAEMMSHLKIGVKDSVTETLRIHYLWDAEEQKIAIGHCGAHLDHK